jgi:beta-carotene 3-hydroxylase
MGLFYNLLVFIGFYCGMELTAWATHKFVMHGFMWYFHKDHHQKEHNWYEKNDVFFLIFAIPGCLFVILGAIDNFSWFFFAGLGITLYGFSYFLVHDIFIHQRIKFFRNTNQPYLLALRRAHKAHHKNIEKEEGVSFGMLIVPKKFYKEAKEMLKK